MAPACFIPRKYRYAATLAGMSGLLG